MSAKFAHARTPCDAEGVENVDTAFTRYPQLRRLNEMMPCVRRFLNQGAARGDELNKTRHAIIAELKRLGHTIQEIKEALLQWNGYCEKPFIGMDREKYLCRYVDWFEKRKDAHTSCKSFEPYCDGRDECPFYERQRRERREQTRKPPFDPNRLHRFLVGRFKADGVSMWAVARALRHFQKVHVTGQIIFVGMRDLSDIIMKLEYMAIGCRDVCRIIRKLEEEGVIGKVVQGRRGTFRGEANGYRFLPWKEPGELQLSSIAD